jgi:hypothetical protein
MGWTKGTDAFARLSVLEQLPYVERYYTPHKQWLAGGGIGAAYVAAFLPALLPHAADQTYVLCATHGPIAWAYADNRSFDTDQKGWISVMDLVSAAERAIAASECARGILAAAEIPIPQFDGSTQDLEIPLATDETPPG